MRKALLVVLLSTTLIFGTFFTIKGEAYLVDDSGLCGAVTASGSPVWSIQKTPNPVDRRDSYFMYIPSDVLADVYSVKMGFYEVDYTLINEITLLSSNTEDDNVFRFNASMFPDWSLYGGRIAFTITSIAIPALTFGEAETSFEADAMILYDTATNLSRMNIFEGDYETVYDEGFIAGRVEGRDQLYNNGSVLYGYSLDGSYDYIAGAVGSYSSGQDDMYNNGSALYGYDPDGAYDFIAGRVEGSSHNVNAGMTMFMAGFEKWIVPAIVIVILLGGFITIAAIKSRRGD